MNERMHENRTKREKIELAIIISVSICYLLVLIKVLIVSRLAGPELLGARRSVNFIPFYSIVQFLSGATENLRDFSSANVVGNIILFVPLGAYLAVLRPGKGAVRTMLLVFLASVLVEAAHGIFAIGAADIDDVILNCAGGAVGLFGYKLIVRLLRREDWGRTAIAAVSILGLPVLLYLLFVINMRF